MSDAQAGGSGLVTDGRPARPPFSIAGLPPDEAIVMIAGLTRAGVIDHVAELAELGTGQDRQLALAAIGALAETGREAVIEAIAQVGENATDREARKEARRVLHRLKSSGVVVEAPAARALKPALATYRGHRAFASVVDGVGNQVIRLGLTDPSGGVEDVQALVSDTVGILDLSIEPRGRSRFDREVATLPRDEWPFYVEIPPDYARHLVRQAAQLGQKTGRGFPLDYLAWQQAFVDAPEFDEPPVYRELGAAEVRWNPEYLERSPQLLGLPQFRGWALEPERAVTYLNELQKPAQSTIVLPGHVQERRTGEVFSRAIRELFDAETRERYRRRLESQAYLLAKSGYLVQARWALAAAVELSSPAASPLQLDRPREHPFLAALLEATFASLEARARPGAERGQLWTPTAGV